MADPNLQGALAGAAIYQQLLDKHPDWAPFFEAVPELRDLFVEWVTTPGMTEDKFADKLFKTNWWRTTPQSARAWVVTTVHDPGQANRQRQQTINQYYDMAAQLGVSVPVNNMYLLAEAGLRQGWDENEIRRAILEQAHGKDPLAGTVDATATRLRGVASEWGVPYGDDQSFEEAKKIQGGRGSVEGFTERMRQQAKSLFPALAESIDKGTSVRQYAEPYAQMASQLLEMDSSQFDLSDDKFRRLLQRYDEKSGKFTPLTLAEARSTMMTDRRYGYDYTRNAHQDATSFLQDLGERFGKTA
jgi:hypothetical protein